MTPRPAILVDIGDDVLLVLAKMPVTVRAVASVANDAAAAGPAAPAGFSVATVADGVLISWTAVPGLTYEVEAAPDVAGVPGTFAVLERDLVAALYLAGATTTSLRWYRVRARNDAGVPGTYAGPASASIRSSATLASGLTQAQADIATEVTARANGDSALAGQITSLTTTVNGNTASITSQQTSINGLLARASVRLDVNGRITGYTLNNNGGSGDMDIVADNFRLFDPPDTTAVLEYLEAAPGPGKSLIEASFTFRRLIRATAAIYAQQGIDATTSVTVRRQTDGAVRHLLSETNASLTGPATVDGQNVVRAVQNATADAAGNVLIPELTGMARLGAGGAQGVSDWNAALSNGWFMADGAANAPAFGWLLGQVVVHNNQWVTQEVWQFTLGVDAPRFRRFRLDGTWTLWEVAARAQIEARLNDTRGFNAPVGNWGRRVVWDFKSRSTLGWPGSAVFGALATISQWDDDSGGGDHQLVMDDTGRLFHRYGTRAGGWGAWREMWHSGSPDISDTRGNLRDTPVNAQPGNYTFTADDRGRKVLKTATSNVTYTLPAGFPVGTTIIVRNKRATGTITIARSGTILRMAGSGTDANRTIAPWGEAVLHHEEQTEEWVISGTGVS